MLTMSAADKNPAKTGGARDRRQLRFAVFTKRRVGRGRRATIWTVESFGFHKTSGLRRAAARTSLAVKNVTPANEDLPRKLLDEIASLCDAHASNLPSKQQFSSRIFAFKRFQFFAVLRRSVNIFLAKVQSRKESVRELES